MIDDAWRAELVKVAGRLEAKTKQKRWTNRTGYLIERDFMVGAHAMRKLIEAHEVPVQLSGRDIPVRRFDRSGNTPRSLSPDDITDCFDFENGRRRTLSVVDLCDEIIDSFVFTCCCGETDDLFDGIYVSSDRDNPKYVYLVLASDFIALCCDIGTADAQSR